MSNFSTSTVVAINQGLTILTISHENSPLKFRIPVKVSRRKGDLHEDIVRKRKFQVFAMIYAITSWQIGLTAKDLLHRVKLFSELKPTEAEDWSNILYSSLSDSHKYVFRLLGSHLAGDSYATIGTLVSAFTWYHKDHMESKLTGEQPSFHWEAVTFLHPGEL